MVINYDLGTHSVQIRSLLLEARTAPTSEASDVIQEIDYSPLLPGCSFRIQSQCVCLR